MKSRLRAVPGWLIVVVLVVATVLAAALGFARDAKTLAADRRAVADSAAGALNASLLGTVERTQAIASLYEVSPSVTEADFATFANPLVRQSGAAAML